MLNFSCSGLLFKNHVMFFLRGHIQGSDVFQNRLLRRFE